MTSVLQFRRGNTAQNNSFTGAVAEISIDTSTNTLRVHNAVTPGGTFIMPTLRLTNAERLTTTAQIGQFIYVTDHASAGVAPTWVGDGTTTGGLVAAGGVVSAASTASNLSAGTAGQIPYQTAPGVTSFFGPGSAGQFLLSNGTSAPSFTSTLTLTGGSVRVNGTTNATSTSTGALIVAGGIGVAGDVYVGGKIVSQQLEIQLTTVTTTLIQTDDVIKTSNSTAAHNATTGALQIAGGIGVGGSIFVAGNVTATTFIGNLTGTASTATAAATAYSTIGIHTAGTGLTGSNFNGSANQTWTLNTATLMQTSVNLNGGTAGSVPYQTSAGATTFLGIGTNGFVLTSNGSAPIWSALSGLSAGSATTASNIAGGLADQIPYQSAPGQTTFNAALRFNGTSLTATNIVVSGTTNSLANTSTQGALLVTGGASIARDLFVGGDINLQGNLYLKGAGLDQITGSTGTFDFITIEGTGTSLTVFDGVTIGGDTLITKTTAASSTNTGALQVRGGAGIAGGLVVGTVVTATNFSGSLSGGTGGAIVYQSAANTTAFLSTATAGNFLQSNFNGAPTWTTTASMYVNRATLADVATTATSAGTAYATIAAHTAGAGLSGTTFNGSTAVTWTLNTATYMASAVTANNLAAGAAGSVPYQSGAGTTTFLGIGTNGFVLTSNGSAPIWSALSGLSAGSATTASNIAGGTAGQVPYQTAGGVTSFYGPGTVGQLLVSGGTSAPVYTNTASIYVQDANVSTNIRGGTPFQIPYQSAANTTAFANSGTTGQFWQATTNGAPTWTTTANIYVANAAVSTNLRSGAAGSLPYQTAANATGFVSIAAAGNMLVSTGSTPSWVATSSIYVNRATLADAVLTAQQPASANYYPTFVDANNASASTELVWTTSTFYINPASGATNLQSLSINSLSADTGTKTSNSLYVAGGAWIDKTLLVAGDTTFRGSVIFQGTNTFVYSSSTVYTDNLLSLHAPSGSSPGNHDWTIDDGKDIGFMFHYYKTTDKDAFLGLANDTGYLEWYENGTESGGVFTGSTYGTFKTGAIKLVGGAANGGNTSTGDLTVLGGVGVGGSVYVAGNITVAGTINASITGVTTTATNIAGGTAGQFPYQTGPGVTSFVTTATTGNFLQANFTGAPTWTTTANIYVANANVSTNLRSGVAGQLAYQTAANATGFITTATTGNFLQSNFNGAPTWTTTANIYVNRATLADSATTATSAGTAYATIAAHTAGTGLSGTTFNGSTAVTWTLNTATLMQTATRVVGAHTAGTGLTGTSYDGSAAVTWTLNTATYMAAAVTANNLAGGSAGQFAFQTGAGATSFASTGSMYVGRAVIADSASGGSAQVNTVAQPLSANYFPTFVDSNNASSAAELVYTTSSFVVNPGTGFVGIGGIISTASMLTVNGRIESITDSASEGGQLVLRGKNFYRWSFDNYLDRFRIIREDDVSSANGIEVLTITSATAAVLVGTNSQTTGEKFGVSGGVYVSGAVTATSFVGNLTGNVTGNLTGTASNATTATSAGTAYATIAAHTAGAGLSGTTFNGSTAVTWTLNTATYMASAVTANNLAAGTGGSLPYQSAAGTTTFLGIGTNGFVLTSNGTAPTWTALSGLSAGSATTASNAAVAYSTIGSLTAGTGLTGTTFNGSANQTWTLNTATLMQTSVSAGVATQVQTTALSVAGTYYPAFVDANNASAAAETVYTTSSFRINPSSGIVSIANTLTAIPNTNLSIRAPDYTLNFGDGQYLYLQAGGGSISNGFGNGGNTYLLGGTGGTASGIGGTVFITGGTSQVGNGGEVRISGGSGPQAGGAVTISVPSNQSSSQTGGHVQITAGTVAAGTTNIAGGNIILTGGRSTGNANGGKLIFHTYSPVASGTGNGTFVGSMFEVSNTGAVAFGGASNFGSSGQILQSNGNASPTWVNASAISAGSTTAALTMNNSGSGAASGTTFNGSTAQTISYNTIGAPSTTGANATGTWGINISGNLTSSAPQLAAATESNSIYITAPSYSTDTPVKLLNFDWYGNLFSMGNIRSGATPSAGFGFYYTASGGSRTELMRLGTAGGLSLGTTAVGSAGEIRATNEITAYYSDRRLKENVKIIENAVEKVKSLNGITYTPNDLAESFGYDKTVKLVGLFADEVEAVLPEAARPAPFDQDENGNSISGENYKTIQYEKIVPLLVEAIKEQERTIQSLKAELNDIKNQLGK